MSDNDQRAFRAAMHGVRPLPSRAAVAVAPQPRSAARLARADARAVLHESPLPPADPALLAGGEQLSFRRPGVREDVLRRLRRGQFAVAAEIDLHGLGRHAAHAALRDFITAAAARGLGCVRVIHGKGRGSGQHGPVLKHVVDHCLRSMDDVLAFVSARPVDGGTGAAYVLLAADRTCRAGGRGPGR